MKPRINIDFCDLGYNHSKTDHFLYWVLSQRFDLDLCDQPDFLVYNVFGHAYRLHSGVRIMFCAENNPPDFNECDYSVSACPLDDPRHLYLPCYAVRGPAEKIIKQHDDHEAILASKTKFCNLVTSYFNPKKTPNRLRFFQKLSKYKRVDSGGNFMNNIGGAVPNGATGKVDFMRSYKFNICFENSSRPGWTSEKIYDAMVARCLPIYWGDPDISHHFNPRSFLNTADFPSDEALIEKIIELDRDDAKYLEYMRQPYVKDDRPPVYFSIERIQDFFQKIFTTPITPVAQRRRRSLFGRWTLAKRYHRHPYPKAVKNVKMAEGFWPGSRHPDPRAPEAFDKRLH